MKRNEYLTREVLVSFIKDGYSVPRISDKTGASIFKIKMSLIKHGLFTGKLYSHACEGCGTIFYHFIKTPKFCSNICKHKYQLIWNRGKTKYTDLKIKQSSDRMIGNTKGERSEKLVELELPVHKIKISYNKKSETERTFLLSLDKDESLVAVRRCDFKIPYLDSSSGKQRYHVPDFLITWKTGLNWIVEIKGRLSVCELDKIIAAQKYASENGMRYKLITSGLVKYNLWNYFYHHTKVHLVPSREYVMMCNACSTSLFSCDSTRKVGCIVVSNDFEQLYGYGYNGDERDGPNLSHTDERGKTGFIHAEENVLIKLKGLSNGIMFVTDAPCEDCAKRIINSRAISEVYYLREYRNMAGVGLLISHGIKTYKFQLLDNHLKAIPDDLAFKFLLPVGYSVEQDSIGYSYFYPTETA